MWQYRNKCPSHNTVLTIETTITIVRKKSICWRTLADCIQMFKEPELFLTLSWNALRTLFNEKKGGTIYICFPYKWKRQFLRRENKDIDSQSKSFQSGGFCGIYPLCAEHLQLGKKKKKKRYPILFPQRLLFAERKLVIWPWGTKGTHRHVINILSVVF